MTSPKIWISELGDYKLLDSGNGKKLEEISGIRMIRSEPKAWWQQKLNKSEWNKAIVKFEHEKGKWNIGEGVPKDLFFDYSNLKLKLKFPLNSKHFGIFPEQESQWRWIKEECVKKNKHHKPIKVLNLFGYTGVATLVASANGAQVTQVDGSRTIINWARENQDESKLNMNNIRWILDDVMDFVKREVKRGNKYDAIIMDPPSFGRGPKGQVWKIENDLVPLLYNCRRLLSDEPAFVILNMYSTELSSITLKNLIEEMMAGINGQISFGELALKEDGGDRLLPLSIFTNWSSIK